MGHVEEMLAMFTGGALLCGLAMLAVGAKWSECALALLFLIVFIAGMLLAAIHGI